VKGSESEKKGKSFHFFSFISRRSRDAIEIWNKELPFASVAKGKDKKKPLGRGRESVYISM
jgi:hypothetical protein